MISRRYEEQVRLLLRILPYVADEECFALKGGTAINLFVRDLPRLSVDIDLTYVPIAERDDSLIAISEALDRIRARVSAAIPGVNIPAASRAGEESKLVCLLGGANVKIEVNTTLRGVVWPTRTMTVAEPVEDEFGFSATMQVVSHAELFGGKIAAALDRQHPRDLFDVWQLYEHEGLSDEVLGGFLVSLISHGRPMHELLAPNLLDQSELFATQFEGMPRIKFGYDAFVATRGRLVADIVSRLSDRDKRFLLSFKQADPDWSLAPAENLEHLPAVMWKLQNLGKLLKSKAKHQAQMRSLNDVLAASDPG